MSMWIKKKDRERWLCSVVVLMCCALVITTAQLHSTKPELRFCTVSNPAHSMLEIGNGEDLWQWSRLEIRLSTFHQSTIPQKQFIIIILIIIIIIIIISIQNYTQHDLTLANLMELLKSRNFPIMTSLINFCLDKLYPILLQDFIIYLNILWSNYPHSASEITWLKIPKNLFKNLRMYFFRAVIQS